MNATTVTALRGVFGMSAAITPALTARVAGGLFCLPLGPRRINLHDARCPRAELFTLGTPGKRIEGYAWRLDTGRPRVMLAHGWGGWGLQLSGWINPLLDAGYEVVSFDQPGHGRSSGWSATGASFAQSIRSVAASLGPFDAIIGHSFGAAIGALTLATPNQAHRAARAAVLIASPSDLIDATRSFATAIGLNEPVRARMQRYLEARIGIRMETFSVRQAGPEVTVPALVVHDRNDREIPFACAEQIQRYWGGPIEILPTSGLGHRRIVNDAGVIRAGVAFLGRVLLR